jgi:hypothetical protein
MSVRCEPPEGLRDQPGFHYVRVNRAEVVMAWETYAPGQDWRWRSWGRSVAPDSETARAWTYICPVPTPAEIAAQADAIERFEEDVMLFGRGYLSGKKEGVVRQVSPLAVPAERAAPPDDAYARGYRDGQVAMREETVGAVIRAVRYFEEANSAINSIRALPIKEPKT